MHLRVPPSGSGTEIYSLFNYLPCQLYVCRVGYRVEAIVVDNSNFVDMNTLIVIFNKYRDAIEILALFGGKYAYPIASPIIPGSYI